MILRSGVCDRENPLQKWMSREHDQTDKQTSELRAALRFARRVDPDAGRLKVCVYGFEREEFARV